MRHQQQLTCYPRRTVGDGGWRFRGAPCRDVLVIVRAALPDWESRELLAAELVAHSHDRFAGWGEVVMFAAATAARIGEVSGVRVRDIDTRTRSAHRSTRGTSTARFEGYRSVPMSGCWSAWTRPNARHTGRRFAAPRYRVRSLWRPSTHRSDHGDWAVSCANAVRVLPHWSTQPTCGNAANA